jgi:hypothetical protein
MKNNTINIIVATMLLLTTNILSAQENNKFNNSKHRIGFVFAFGYQTTLTAIPSLNGEVKYEEVGLNVEYEYEVDFFQAQYYYKILAKKTWGLDLLVQPQYNTTVYRLKGKDSEKLKGYEFGVNFGVLIRKNIFKDFLSLYSFISVGPHYVSGVPQRQSKGFIFSDNLFIGSNIKLHKKVYLDIRSGLRHISNASITNNNGGVNNLVSSIGFLVNL